MVERTFFAVHAYHDTMCFKVADKGLRVKLAALIDIEKIAGTPQMRIDSSKA